MAQTWLPCGTGTGGVVRALQSYSGNLYVGGHLITAGGNPVSGIARWNGSVWDTWSPLCTGNVFAFDSANGKLYAGGDFQQMDNSWSFCVSKWDNSAWSQMDNGVDYSNNMATPQVATLGTYNGSIYAGGNFNEAYPYYNTNTINNLARWNDTNWVACDSGLDLPPTLNGARVQALLEYNGELYAGGNFTVAGSNPINFIARWDGTSWRSCGTGMNDAVTSLAVFNGELYAGGYFTTADGNPANHIAKWNGVSWSACALGTNNEVHALKMFCGKLYVGGNFTLAGGNPASRMATWDGTSWAACGLGTNSVVYSLAAFNGSLYVGGNFTLAGGNPANHIAIYDTLALSVRNNVVLNESVSIYPSPTTGSISIQINSSIDSEIQIEIVDVFGQVILQRTEKNNSGSAIENLNVSSFMDGVYFVSIKENGTLLGTQKFIKEH